MDLWIAHNVEQVHFTKTRLTIYHKNNKIIIFTPYALKPFVEIVPQH